MLQVIESAPQGSAGGVSPLRPPVRPPLRPLAAFDGSLANRAYLALKEAILALAYPPGEILRKGEICDHLGVSRSPVSEAMLRLAAEGLVDVVPQAGSFVARLSMDEVREGAFLREALEVAAAELVARTATDDQIRQLDRNLRLQEAHVTALDAEGFHAADAAMHDLMLSFTGHRRLAGLSQTAWVHVNRARRLLLPQPGRIAQTVDEHRAIVAAIAAHAPEAAGLATRRHLRQMLTLLEPLAVQRPELFS